MKKSKDNYNVDVEHLSGPNGCAPDCPACKYDRDHTPDIWLQEYEAEGMAKCGCKLLSHVDGEDKGAALFYCPLHEAAPALLKACKAARISVIDDEKYAEFKPLLETLEAAIKKATPPKAGQPGWFA